MRRDDLKCGEWSDRVKELRRVRAGDLVPHPKNWRVHPARQRKALAGLLSEVGFAGAVLVRERSDGKLQLIDGHLRIETADAEMLVPALVLDVSEAEAEKLLALVDPVGALAERDDAHWRALVEGISSEDEVLAELMAVEPIEIAAPASEEALAPSWQLLVECDNEEEQRALYERLHGEGRTCRVLTSW